MANNTNNNTSNKILVPEARQALNQMKLEIASELGLANYDNIDKGNLPSRQNGYVGGYMTKNLVRMAQQSMSGMAGTTGQQPGGTSQ
ncbi:MAG: alpha/beta-type small acid-soluble spore protein [Tissierellia bacterium]|nr:alpha/beta-type small acid-soluble spore protein [Tissierellia bacterium]